MKEASLYIFIFLFAFSVVMIVVEQSRTAVTGFASEGSTTSKVTIKKFLAISMSQNLADGIVFEEVSTLPASNKNADHNSDGAGSGTTSYITLSTDSNTDVDFCIKASDDLYDSVGGNRIALNQESYANSLTTDIDNPALASEVSLTAGYVKAGEGITRGNSNYYRFWLDVPAATEPGSYENIVYFKGVETGGSCGV